MRFRKRCARMAASIPEIPSKFTTVFNGPLTLFVTSASA